MTKSYMESFDLVAKNVPTHILAAAMSDIHRGSNYRGCSKSFMRELAARDWIPKNLSLNKLEKAIIDRQEAARQRRLCEDRYKAEKIMRRRSTLKNLAELTSILDAVESDLTCTTQDRVRFFSWARTTLENKTRQERGE